MSACARAFASIEAVAISSVGLSGQSGVKEQPMPEGMRVLNSS